MSAVLEGLKTYRRGNTEFVAAEFDGTAERAADIEHWLRNNGCIAKTHSRSDGKGFVLELPQVGWLVGGTVFYLTPRGFAICSSGTLELAGYKEVVDEDVFG